MAQQENPSKNNPSGWERRNGAADDAAQSERSGEAADNEGFHAARPDPEESERTDDPGAQGNDPATGGPRDPRDAEQNPAGQDDTEQNPPLPRTWN
ncbi:hypothetical protein QMA10_05965 [Arthrobacter sp. APC 3897]|uniref:hypothetical protein n=1 Tax=Arthrobacter sp. APC 3897 TaxID=3035204 RepID=UPI0025B4C508|nr:hypothetical protein [Arthrobacter sp. APC 3897]MDN3481466.1 hypothetical protein [Arthrobacter sp. APC 3897]